MFYIQKVNVQLRKPHMQKLILACQNCNWFIFVTTSLCVITIINITTLQAYKESIVYGLHSEEHFSYLRFNYGIKVKCIYIIQ